MMAVAAGALFVLVFFFAPRHGVVSRILNRTALSLKILRDDCLCFLYRFQELAPAGAPEARASDLEIAVKAGSALRLVLWDLTRKKLIRRADQGLSLTEGGRAAARSLVRSHRLWEAYLCDKLGFCAEGVHYSAHQLEHVTDEIMQERLQEETGHPIHDPHRRRIP
jgi:Mn-dependent DtxR family transcriptional regulator